MEKDFRLPQYSKKLQREISIFELELDMRKPGTLHQFTQRHISDISKGERSLCRDVLYANMQN